MVCSTSFLGIYLIFISQQIRGKPLSCEWFHKGRDGTCDLCNEESKAHKNTSHYVQMSNNKKAHASAPEMRKRINKHSHAAVTLFHEDGCFFSAPLPLGERMRRDWDCSQVPEGEDGRPQWQKTFCLRLSILSFKWGSLICRCRKTKSILVEAELHCFCKQQTLLID